MKKVSWAFTSAQTQTNLHTMKSILTVDDVAELLDCSVGHIYNLISAKEIPSRKKRGRRYFHLYEILNWIDEE